MTFIKRNLYELLMIFLLCFIAGIVTLFLLRFYTPKPREPACSDKVAYALTHPETETSTFDECLTEAFQSRYPDPEHWQELLRNRWNIPPFISDLDEEYAQQANDQSWNVFYVAIVDTPTGPRAQSVRLFLRGNKVDAILF